MKILHKFLLSAIVAGALAAGSASANVVGPGNGGGGGYVGAVKTIVYNVPGYGMNYAVDPTYNGCVNALQAIVNAFVANPTLYIVQVIPCHWQGGGGTPVELTPGPISGDRIIGQLHEEQALRDEFGIDAYEQRLHKIWEPAAADGGH